VANTEHLHSAGSSLGYSTTNGAYTTMTDVREIDPPALDRGDSPDTSLDSANATEEHTPGWRKTDTCTVTVYLTRAQLAAMMVLYALSSIAAVYYWLFALPKLSTETNASTLQFQGYLKTVKIGKAAVGQEEKITVTLTIMGSKGAVWTSGS